jgi:predicted amidohydrolase
VKIGLAQLNTRVGAIDANTDKVLDYAARARDLGCELVLFPELTLCGYPPEDLLLHRGLRSRVEAAFETVRSGVKGIAVYLGYPEYDGGAIYNSGALLRDGQVLANHRKSALPKTLAPPSTSTSSTPRATMSRRTSTVSLSRPSVVAVQWRTSPPTSEMSRSVASSALLVGA